ncbi:MAG TPA: flagellar hook-associated protein FlgK [Herbaspirillum sp.]|jgi:flagellar hook-associated protein 1 FlgK
MSNILSIGESALFAAQAQLATTSHNLANAGVAGYTRQVVQQASAGAQNMGNGFIGQGTVVNSVTRVYDGFLTKQILTAQTSASAYGAYGSEISQIDNVVGDSDSGLSPALASFFKGMQDLTANSSTDASRQAVISGAQILAARFNSLSQTLTESRNSVNSQITSNVQTINSYATQISALNSAIAAAQGATGQPPNDLLDQRDQIVASLNKIVKVTTLPQDNGGVDVMIGNGQPLVLGNQVSTMVALPSKDDPSNLQLGIVSNNVTIPLPDSSISGGVLGGLLDYRTESLTPIQNQLGQIATVLASTMNAQNRLGLDQNGNPGGDFFSVSPPAVIGRTGNSPTAQLSASVTDASKLTTSDYRMTFDGANYTVTRLSDGTTTNIPGPPTAYPVPAPEIDGVTFSAPTMAAGDSFTVKPTANAAATLSVVLTGNTSIATAAPIVTAQNTANTGTGKISAGSVDKNFLTAPAGTKIPLTMTFGTTVAPALPTNFVLTDGAGNPVTTGVTINGVAVTGSPITYTAGATVTFQGSSFVMSGAPGSGDSFTVGANTNGDSDNRNIQAMAALQTTNTIGGDTYQGAYSTLVSFVGNKTNEVNVLGAAQQAQVDAVTQSQQSESGVSSDEELANMVRYQTAYQAGAKIIQAASDMLNVLFTLGG